ncbi:hypothetical protein A3H03_02220 [Candidatus Kuenenbacteria bacterium RIFCSPLOWO2_12_FULL_42_13]|uniref:LysM domain-containing protein n=3 Tax=Candidatus Kueneniibacteriota TaxID=1752740 RepID=A0A1F6G326_9BACT|nr:MAG: hypothetical protein A3C68_00360 [Candidatus Kuenenbacteria bacterium RIFCSPHIGHO2_02_FULL_42_29]OGG90617.1 MAG: hypothetical protein A3H55_00455 [Candidatus Kuenenbacteria bacterium RIFCSPLOWO2_02_FULL_42_16]OGG92499.1 MAG: hypothetical protein A3H03_02220 [Candidatus Kuenenbacteria bacterium RIFCSPLOWO2_12_FULL_42_13]OGG98491.1 MAG: hypothetical protein A3E04_01260 [Candidatus Kuenenbacteria bacterium RIFCSPHIGHO2_12_FULL_42_14]
MLKKLRQLAVILWHIFSKITLGLGKGLWQIFFERLLVPGYKGFLFGKKQINNIFFEPNPENGARFLPKSFHRLHLVHSIILMIFILNIINNFTTKNTYAEEFNKNSVLAKIFISEDGEEIVEKPVINNKKLNQPKSENILAELATIENKKYSPFGSPADSTDNNMLAILSQSGEALIKSGASPFLENTNTTGSANNTIQSYEVQAGDTLSSIAVKFNISVNTLLWENNLSLKSYIRPGEKLTILPASGVSYVVKAGDTISGIAKKFNASVNKILSYNKIDDSAAIKIKQKLIIPDAKPISTGSLVAKMPSAVKNIFSKPSSASGGDLFWPTVSRRITQYFSWRHTAIDIGAKSGAPIYAISGGRVERAGWSTGYGYNIVINHGNGLKSLYAHAQRLYVKTGDQISAGEVIGEVGSTGWSTGPHIHLEIIINGARVNPLSYL